MIRQSWASRRRRYLRARADGARTIDHDALGRFLGEIKYPVYYFDYETSQGLIPPWDGTRPYQQVPFQYSLHIQREPGGDIEHREFLHRDKSNPMPALLERLREDIGEVGSVLVWYEPFEKTRNNEMAATFPEYATFLNGLNARVIDLMKPFSDEMINDAAFKGSASIKAVLPALLPELSYDDLDIQEGASASRLWKEVTLTNPGVSGARESLRRSSGILHSRYVGNGRHSQGDAGDVKAVAQAFRGFEKSLYIQSA